MIATRVVAIGRPLAGDDGVGVAVLAELRRRTLPGLVLRELGDPAHLVDELLVPGPVVIVDAVLGSPPGDVIEISEAQLAERDEVPAVHGIGVATAIRLARALAAHPLEIRIVGITIEPPCAMSAAPSPGILAAVPAAVERIISVSAG